MTNKENEAVKTAHIEDFLYELEGELQKPKSLLDMIQNYYMAADTPEEIEKWMRERKILWAGISILDDYISSVLQMLIDWQEAARRSEPPV